jgi:hypothetical protein
LIKLSSITDKLVGFQTQGAYPEAHVDVNLSNNDDTITAPKPDMSTDQKGAAGDDAGDDGVTSAELIPPGPINSAVPEQSKCFITDRVPAIVPSSGKRGHKRPPPVTKWSNPIASPVQVMSQVELPPYREPCSPLDLVTIEIIFRCIFEAFQRISQATIAGVTIVDVDKPRKRVHHLSIRKALMPR